MRRLCAWFDDKFHGEVTSKLLYERVNKKMHRDRAIRIRKNVKAGAKPDQVSPRLHGLASGPAALAGGERDDAGRFHGGGASELSRLYLGRGLEPACGTVKDWYAKIKSRPSFRPLAGRPGSGLSAARALCRPGFLTATRRGRSHPPGPPSGYLANRTIGHLRGRERAADGTRAGGRVRRRWVSVAPDAVPEAAGRLAAFLAAGRSRADGLDGGAGGVARRAPRRSGPRRGR